jgi:peptide/nickel transport system substrate-binding protein
MELAREYMRKAGYQDGRYSGPPIDLVADSTDPDRAVAELAIEQFRQLGFNVRSRFVLRDTMLTKFCAAPENEPDICPGAAWAKDFNDGQTILGPTFDADAIVSQGNSNWSLLDVPKINKAMDEAALLTGPAERAKAWGAIDRMVTAQAAAIPYAWDNQLNVRSANVVGVINLFNASWDPSFSSLEK